jgi:hypothetical protein
MTTRICALAVTGMMGLVFCLAMSGCTQGEGERCQLTDDCMSGLVCELGGNTPAMGGYCKNTTAVSADMASTDAANAPADMTTPDM